MEELKKFANWWSLSAGAGFTITVASIYQQNPVGMYFGAGLLLIGVGEWICRPQKTEVFNGPTPGSFITRRSNPWKPKPIGIIFDVLGAASLAHAIYLVAFAR
jgi:hypothetical protein